MLKLFLILIALLMLPTAMLAAPHEDVRFLDGWAGEDEYVPPSLPLEWIQAEWEAPRPERKRTLVRQRFELGIDAGSWLGTSFFGLQSFFQEEAIIDLNDIRANTRRTGFNINAPVLAGFHLDFKNIRIRESYWGFGFFAGVDGRINLLMQESFVILLAEGNINQRVFEGDVVNISGAIFASAGVNLSARFGRLTLGVTPAVFTPLVFIPAAGVGFTFKTEDSVSLELGGGAINVYSPFLADENFNIDIASALSELKLGYDLTLATEVAISSMFDAGGRIRLPILAATGVTQGMRITLPEYSLAITSDDIMNGRWPDEPDLSVETDFGDLTPINISRPFKFNTYLRVRPFHTELFAVKPNVGFTYDLPNDNLFFNAGIGLRLNLINMLILDLGTNYEEAIWRHSFGLAFNLRAMEINLKAAFLSNSFIGAFNAQSFSANIGLRFGF